MRISDWSSDVCSSDLTELENFLRMERWIFDSPDQVGEAFREFIKWFYQGNGFVNGGVQIGGREVRLDNVGMPVLNIFAEQDHLEIGRASCRERGCQYV